MITIKFTLNSGDVDFEESELCLIDEGIDQNLISQKSQQDKYWLQAYNDQYKFWKVSILESEEDSWDKIMQIINEQDEMVFYPNYQYDSTNSYNVILVPDEIKKVYTFGAKERYVMTSFNLLESSK